MDRERLTELLQDPSQVAKQDLTALRTMAERFPWFSCAHLLLAVGEHETGDVLANDRHSTPAAFLPSRAVLFDLVRQEEQKRTAPLRVVKDDAPLPIVASAPEPTIVAEPKAVQPEVQVAGIPEEVVQAVMPEAPVAALLEEEATAAAPDLIAPASVPTAPSAPEKIQAPPDPAAAILELQIQQAILATGYDLGRYEAPPAAAAPAPPDAIPPAPKHLPPVQDVIVEMAAAPSPASAKDEPAPALHPISPGTRLRFTDWLERSEDELHIAPPPIPAQPASAEIPAPAVPPLSPVVAAILPDLSPGELMEQFIQRSSPLPTAAKAEFFTPQQAAKRSLQDDGLVSETLARIHEKQGNFAKAKEVYDRLAVKHPEKSVYFAALSKALEGRMHK
ncbi:MAG: hypothetical protein ABIQ75_04880 [Flavobacteriales bacterium]